VCCSVLQCVAMWCSALQSTCQCVQGRVFVGEAVGIVCGS